MEPKIKTNASKQDKDICEDDMSTQEATLEPMETKLKSAV